MDKALKADGFDDCIIGICERYEKNELLAYDKGKMIKKMMDRDGMTYEEAVEYFNFNILGANMGDGTPVYIDTDKEEIERLLMEE